MGLLAGSVGRLSPLLAAVLHNASSVAVVANSARLIRFRVPPALVSHKGRPALASRPGARGKIQER
jgi:cation-transporting P-type ATPase C